MLINDDKEIFVLRRDMSGGANNRLYAGNIGENQMSSAYNIDLGIPGKNRKRPGLTGITSLASFPADGAFGFEPRGGYNRLLVSQGAILYGYTGSSLTCVNGSLTSISSRNFVPATLSNGDDVFIVADGTNNVFQVTQTYNVLDCADTNTSPPLTSVYDYYRNRLWGLKANKLYWSSALPASNASLTGYKEAFDRTTNYFNVPVGKEQALVGIRDQGLIALGEAQIWGINPSVAPVATDKPEKMLDIGCVAGNTARLVNDDLLFLARDGVRGLYRTIQDKLQATEAFPLSYPLKTEFEAISWGSITKACAIFFDNKYFISLPTTNSTYNNQVWIYYPALKAWVVVTGWNVGKWETVRIAGEERLFATDSRDGRVYRAWYGYSDDGTAINYQEEGRNEDLGFPLLQKTGGEVWVKAAVAGDYDLSVYISVDDSIYNYLGKINLNGDYVEFPTTFPVTFSTNPPKKKYFTINHLGNWYVARLKITHNATNGDDNIEVLERGIISYLESYQTEEN